MVTCRLISLKLINVTIFSFRVDFPLICKYQEKIFLQYLFFQVHPLIQQINFLSLQFFYQFYHSRLYSQLKANVIGLHKMVLLKYGDFLFKNKQKFSIKSFILIFKLINYLVSQKVYF
jgi:hypothetical protein